MVCGPLTRRFLGICDSQNSMADVVDADGAVTLAMVSIAAVVADGAVTRGPTYLRPTGTIGGIAAAGATGSGGI